MTRINVINPSLLHDAHLLAEEREIVRIPNQLISGRLKPERVETYRLGAGHVKFFTTRLSWLHRRYQEVHDECLMRGFKPLWKWPDVKVDGDWTPTEESVMINIERVKDRTLGAKRNPRYCGKEIERTRFIKTMYGNL